MEKMIFKVRCLFFAALLLCVVFFMLSAFHNDRIVATAQGNKILYNNETYIESFEVFNFKKGRCLGSVRLSENNSRYKMYSLHGKPEYIYVDMWADHRLYTRVLDE